MAVEEITRWRTRCNRCGVVYGDEFESRQAAEGVDRFVDGLCDECEKEADRDRVSPVAYSG